MARPPRFGGRFRIAHLRVVRHLGSRRVDRLGRTVRHFVGGGLGLRAHFVALGGVGRVAILTLLVLAILLVALFTLVLVGLAGAVLAHVEAIEEVVHDVAEPALVVDHALKTIEIAAGPFLDQRPPQVDELARGRRRRFAGKPLAHQHGQRVLDRRVGAISNLVELAAMETVVEHRGEVPGNATHAARPDRFDAGLLDRFEHGPSLLAARRELAMHRRVVTGEPQRDRIGVAAHDCSFPRVEPPRRLRQPRLAAGKPGALCREADFEIALAGNRAQADADRSLERFSRRVLGGRFRLDVRGHSSCSFPRGRGKVNATYESATLTADSGNSCPKQR